MSAPSGDATGAGTISASHRAALIRKVLTTFPDPMREELQAHYEARQPHLPLPRPPRDDQRVVLAGHRAAGKSRLLPIFASLLDRPAIDLDRWLERTHGRTLREWVSTSPTTFRAAEREGYIAQPARSVVSLGGGFLSLHADLLKDAWTVLIPIDFDTYCRRLSRDRSRPRLRPELSLHAELREVWNERERLHAQARTIPLWAALRVLA